MRRALACLPLALLFIAHVVPAKAQKTAQAEEVEVRVREGAPLELACALRVEQRAEWRREGGALPAGLAPAGEAPAPGAGGAGAGAGAGAGGAALTARLRAAAARPQHAGVYACARGPGAQRLRVVVEPAPGETTPAAAPAAAGAAGAGAGGAGAGGADDDVVYFDLGRPNNVSLRCPLANPDKLGYVWQVNDTALEQAGALRGRYRLDEAGAQFVLEARAQEDDWGAYSCALAPGGAAHSWRVHARAVAKLAPNTNVVEGQKLKLVCRVLGKPAPPVQWRYRNNSDDAPEAGVDVTDAAALGERARLNASEARVEGAQLVVDAAALGDAGRYTCVPLGPAAGRAPGAAAHTTLRVKDMYAALWPFLGICAEVLVLCVVILVYEKRRTKPELDDSDTDNHDQKKS